MNLRDELAADLTDMNRLHEFSTRLLASTDLQPLLEEILDAVIELQGADMGCIQLYNPQTGALEIVAQRGFKQDFLDHFASVCEGDAACGLAMQKRSSVIIEDVQTDPIFEPHRHVAASAGFRAVHSTPLHSRSGEMLGALSTHFRQPHRPSQKDLRLTDLYARQVAELIERRRAEKEIKTALKEKEVLLKEIHHRVKNNLQIVSSLLNLQSKYFQNEEAREKFKESQNRIKSMALIHEKLYQCESFGEINFRDYVRSLLNYLISSYGINPSKVKLKIDADDVSLGIDKAIPCGLIVNEIVSNSLKYAFPDGWGGEVSVALTSNNGGGELPDRLYTLIVGNNGIPFPEDVDFRSTKSLGLRLVCSLVEQLRGTVELDRNGGTEFRIRLDLG